MFSSNGKVKYDLQALDKLLNQPEGEVGQHLRNIGLKIMVDARKMVGVRTGALRNSIHLRRERKGRYQHVAVIADTKYAEMHHDGTKPHKITASPGRIMRFNVGGKVVYAVRVNHPGTKPRKYLTVPMKRHVR